ncbi:MAG: MarR family winged helix-turn-helix transcriptional regulator [Terriglobia bacterium]
MPNARPEAHEAGRLPAESDPEKSRGKNPSIPNEPKASAGTDGPVARRLQAELQQRVPFTNLEQGVYLSILRTADILARGVEEALKKFDLTRTQYNVLRILRGAGPGGLSCREVGERMLTHDPDVTRLLDRLERRGLIQRQREKRDRRVIIARITDDGLRLLAELDEPVAELHRRQLSHLGPERLKTLATLLEVARGTGE